MLKTVKSIGKGLLWFITALVSTVVAAITAWILYSRKYIRHHLKLYPAVDADLKDYTSEHAGRMTYYSDTRGKGVPLVLLHSINAAPSAFETKPIFEYFRGERPVYALELPGFGFSERSDRVYNPMLYQIAISEFLEEVVGVQADVVALSLSCEFAGLSANRKPSLIRSLVMISPTGLRPPRMSSAAEAARKRGGKDSVYSGLSVGIWNRPFYDLVSSRPSIKFYLNKSFEGLVPAEMLDYAYMTSHQPGAQYAPTYFLSGKMFTPAVRETVYNVIEQPVFVIYDRDPYTNFEMLPMMLRDHDNWRAERITPTKGLPHWEQPEKTLKAMQTFWDGL